MLLEELVSKNTISLAKGKMITQETAVPADIPVVAGGQISPYSHNKATHRGNVITISASGAYSGFVWYHDYPIWASDCSVLFSNDEDTLLTKFLYYALKNGQDEIYKLQHGSGQPHVYPTDLKRLQIPIPSLSIQQEIVNELDKEINFIRQTEFVIAKQQGKIQAIIGKIWGENSDKLVDTDKALPNSFDLLLEKAVQPFQSKK